jgi:DNA processing protein
MSPLPPEAYAAALSALGVMTVRRLGILLRRLDPATAWAVATGHEATDDPVVTAVLDEPRVRASWRAPSPESGPTELWERCRSLGVEVLVIGTEAYPPLLAIDHAAPPVLFVRGDLEALQARRVAIVGTRNATVAGRDLSYQLGAELSAAGVSVVSGLARGIDGAAHRGVIAHGPGRPVGVVASGPDVVYPRQHAELWDHVASRGLLLTEAAPGTPPEAHRFPLRNRVLAALSELVVVVESRERGGSLITAREAQERGIPVMVVPGPPRSRASAGTRALVQSHGAAVAFDADDVLVALGLDTRRRAPLVHDPRPVPCELDRFLLERMGRDAVTIDDLADRTGRPLLSLARALGRLEATHWVQSADGWFERLGPAAHDT